MQTVNYKILLTLQSIDMKIITTRKEILPTCPAESSLQEIVITDTTGK